MMNACERADYHSSYGRDAAGEKAGNKRAAS